MQSQDKNLTTMIRIRPETRQKIDCVAEARSWPIVTVVEKAADALLEKEGIPAPSGPTAPTGRRRKLARRVAA